MLQIAQNFGCYHKNNMFYNRPDPCFIEGINAWLNKNYDDTKYEDFSWQKVLYKMGLDWAKEKKITSENVIETMKSVKNWETLDEKNFG